VEWPSNDESMPVFSDTIYRIISMIIACPCDPNVGALKTITDITTSHIITKVSKNEVVENLGKFKQVARARAREVISKVEENQICLTNQSNLFEIGEFALFRSC